MGVGRGAQLFWWWWWGYKGIACMWMFDETNKSKKAQRMVAMENKYAQRILVGRLLLCVKIRFETRPQK